MAKRVARKTSVIAGVTAGVLSLGVASTALATNATQETATGRTTASDSSKRVEGRTVTKVSPEKVQKKVAYVYNSYIYALKNGNWHKAERVREAHLTARCEKAAKAWAQRHNADPIMRAKGLPRTEAHGAIGGMDWKGSKGDKAYLNVILNYKKPKTVHVTFDTKAGKISAIG